MYNGKFKVGDRVRTLQEEDYKKCTRFKVGTIGTITYFNMDNDTIPIKVGFGGLYYWYSENELELVDDAETKKVSYCDVQRNITVKEVEKLKEELRRKDSELRDLKELIIKLLFDRYGY